MGKKERKGTKNYQRKRKEARIGDPIKSKAQEG